ncbi:methylmalonyl-CoA mutase subunit beta [Frankia sp. Ag45/Mut15]|uniref:methylmalonyl-CoA mutase n=1 Tax=Frankia umida TaxID=573489 RepID=A0ABT0JUR6_9ACTN|nr:methylmalonyl-CoA mutase subunit beta [Frankia umida]MCK9875294.1 methylmalonyl-CoA mutase subunit beta [Frankia umida]
MSVPSGGLSLAADFPESTRGEWQKLVLGVLRKSGVATEANTPADVEDLLATETYDGPRIQPLYTSEDAPAGGVGLPGLAPFVRGGRPQGTGGSGWDVRALHVGPDAKAAGADVLADLESGVTSLWLRLGEGGLPIEALGTVLAEVYLDLAPVALDAGGRTSAAADEFLRVADARGVPGSQLSGSLGADPIGLAARVGVGTSEPAGLDEAAALARRCLQQYPGLRALVVDAQPYHRAGASDAQELAASLATGVAYLRLLTSAGLSLTEALGQLEFRYAVTADQFSSIAKLRAARRLWARVAQVCGASGPERAQRQHAVTSTAMMTRRDPWVNMLRTTLACFAAGVAGADAVTVLPFDARLGLPDDFSRRIARNTQILLQEESSLVRVIDPAGGSWFVESLTESLAEAAWSAFTEIERAGGIVAALREGLVAERIASSRAARAEAIAHRRDPITGVSEFPNVAEKLPDRVPAPPVAPSAPADAVTTGLPEIHYDADFEDLRARADAAAQAGDRPVILLATLGSAAASTARGSFAANLFQAGGFDTPTSGTGTDPVQIAAAFTASGATVACLCSADKVYAEHAATVAAALRAAGARQVWLAGQPGARAQSDAEAGIGGYVFTGCNAVAVLQTALAEAGVA